MKNSAKKAQKGIFGLPRQKTLFSFGGELWSDEDSNDDPAYSVPSSVGHEFGGQKMDGETVIASTSLTAAFDGNGQSKSADSCEPLQERITLTLTKKRKRGRKSKNDCGDDYFVSKNGENSVKNKVKLKSRKKELYEDTDTKQMKEGTFVNEMCGDYKLFLSLEPFLIPCANEVDILLPDHVLKQIFEFVVGDDNRKAVHNLLSLSQASETFRRVITTTSSLWKFVDLSEFRDKTAERDLVALCDLGILCEIEKANLSGWLTERCFRPLIESCARNLKEIVLRECHSLDGSCLQLLAEKCSSLESIDLSRTSYSNFNLRTQGVEKKSLEKSSLLQSSSLKPFLSACGMRIKQLNLAENKINSFTSVISAIMSHCPNLRLLDLSNIETSSSSVIDVDKLQSSCPLLKVLRLANIPLKVSNSAQHSFTHLEELSIPVKNEMQGHSDSVIYTLTRTAENLKLLDIRGSRDVSVSCLVKIPAWSLQHLSMAYCQRLCSPDLELIFRKWKHSLVDLDMSLNNNEKSVGISIDALCSEENTSLKNMNLRGSSVSLEAVKKLFAVCKNLEFVDLQSCRGLPRGIKRVFAGRELEKLKKDVANGIYD